MDAMIRLQNPASTWTYVVNDNPFRDRIGGFLAGPGRTSIAIFAAMWLMPFRVGPRRPLPAEAAGPPGRPVSVRLRAPGRSNAAGTLSTG